jgi:hypothetical protein
MEFQSLVGFVDQVHQFRPDEVVQIVYLLDELFFPAIVTPDEKEHEPKVGSDLLNEFYPVHTSSLRERCLQGGESRITGNDFCGGVSPR